MSAPKGRAATKAQKRHILERLFAAWQRSPYQRLGQLIENAVRHQNAWDTFTIEDEALAELVEKFVETYEGVGPCKP